MRPRSVADKLLQKFCAVNGAAVPVGFAHIGKIAECAFDVCEVLIPERQWPDIVAGCGADCNQFFLESIAIGKERGAVIAECYVRRACERAKSAISPGL